jgi:hypothetical protein
MLFKEIIAVYSENHTKPINTKCSITDCQSRYSYRSGQEASPSPFLAYFPKMKAG